MTENISYDLLIIGGGSAGTTAAIAALDYGASKIGLIEKGLLGGTCTNVGCVPSKSYLRAADLINSNRQAVEYGLFADLSHPDYKAIVEHKNKIVSAMRSAGSKTLEKYDIEIIKEQAVFKDANTLQVGSENLTADNILVATGAKSFIPPIEGVFDVPYLTSTSALSLEKLPESIIIIGGAYIGLEFAAFFHSVGVKTTVIEAAPRLAPNEDQEISSYLATSFEKQGLEFHAGAKVLGVSGDSEIEVQIEKNGEQSKLKGQKVLIAAGRVPNLKELSLESAGIKFGRKGIEVNEYLQTSAPSVYAAGDALTSLQLEHVAVYEGWKAAVNMFSEKKESVDYRVIPRIMFSHPEVASVGETEEQAANRADVQSVAYPYSGIAMANISGETEGLIKLVADSSTGILLGAHIVGKNAGDLIHLGALAMQANIAVDKISDSIAAYPTLAQGFYYAAENLSAMIKQS